MREANQGIQEIAKQYHAEYLDLNAGLTDEEVSLRRELTIDGVHMHVEGYQIVMEHLIPVLYKMYSDEFISS